MRCATLCVGSVLFFLYNTYTAICVCEILSYTRTTWLAALFKLLLYTSFNYQRLPIQKNRWIFQKFYQIMIIIEYFMF